MDLKRTHHGTSDAEGGRRPPHHRNRKYSPDLNPIEKLFAKIKHWLRKAAKRTPEAVCQAVAETLETLTQQECSNYFTSAGYDQT